MQSLPITRDIVVARMVLYCEGGDGVPWGGDWKYMCPLYTILSSFYYLLKWENGFHCLILIWDFDPKCILYLKFGHIFLGEKYAEILIKKYWAGDQKVRKE